jgi:hypothetical protein
LYQELNLKTWNRRFKQPSPAFGIPYRDFVDTLRSFATGSTQFIDGGGTRVKVTEVTVESADPLPDEDGTWLSVDWTVTGTVGHWGHILYPGELIPITICSLPTKQLELKNRAVGIG